MLTVWNNYPRIVANRASIAPPNMMCRLRSTGICIFHKYNVYIFNDLFISVMTCLLVICVVYGIVNGIVYHNYSYFNKKRPIQNINNNYPCSDSINKHNTTYISVE